MHPIEHAIYFTRAPIPLLLLPSLIFCTKFSFKRSSRR